MAPAAETRRVNPFPFRSPPSPNRDSADIYVSLDGNSVVDIQQLSSKKVYESIIAMRAKEPSAKVKFSELFPELFSIYFFLT